MGVAIVILWLGLTGLTQVDAIVAVFNGEVITAQELRLYCLLARQIAGQSLAECQSESPEMAAILERMIDQRLILNESQRFNLSKPDANSLGQSCAEFRSRYFKNQTDYEHFLHIYQITPDYICAEIRNRQEEERFLQMKIGRSTLVDEAAIRQYFETHQSTGMFAQTSFAEARAGIKARLLQERIEQKKQDLVQKLRAKATIKQLWHPKNQGS
jgi:hypothetical protein